MNCNYFFNIFLNNIYSATTVEQLEELRLTIAEYRDSRDINRKYYQELSSAINNRMDDFIATFLVGNYKDYQSLGYLEEL